MTAREDLGLHPRLRALLDGPSGFGVLEHREEVDSTQLVARARLQGGAGPGLVVLADRQTAGRGRRDRAWTGPPSPGASLAITAVVPVPEAQSGLVPLATGLAVADAVRRQGVRPALKWPNDLLLAEQKAGGILVERDTIDAVELLLVGVGVNVDWRAGHPGDEPPDAAWTSIAEHSGADVDRGELVADFLRGLEVWLRSVPEDPLRLLRTYREACSTIGRRVRVSFPDGEVIAGTATDLDREGRLVVELAEGPVAIHAADIEHLRPSGAA